MDDDGYMPEAEEEEADDYNELDDEEQNDTLEEDAEFKQIMDEEIIPEPGLEEPEKVAPPPKDKGAQLLNKIIVPDDRNHKIVNIVPDNKRITSHIIQYNEIANVIPTRIAQIENGAPVFIDITGFKSAKEIAKAEFIQREIPLIVTREVGDDIEQWKVQKMTFPPGILAWLNKHY